MRCNLTLFTAKPLDPHVACGRKIPNFPNVEGIATFIA